MDDHIRPSLTEIVVAFDVETTDWDAQSSFKQLLNIFRVVCPVTKKMQRIHIINMYAYYYMHQIM